AMVDRMHLSGLLAWLVWLLVHIFYLIGFKNRFVVMFTWAWSYVTYGRGARLVVGQPAAELRSVLGIPPLGSLGGSLGDSLPGSLPRSLPERPDPAAGAAVAAPARESSQTDGERGVRA
ncbi:MAG TPA: hypothetical protein VII82_10390, partial [Polyangiaceae bacterium]